MASSSATKVNYTPVKAPSDSGSNVEATKYYVFNETGNIMMSTTTNSSEVIQDSVRQVFNEVSVFFAGMTKAISSTTNPATNKPYSIYNYEALKQVIDKSGLFVQLTEEDMSFTSNSFGVSFSIEIIEAVLGLATGGATALSFASGLISSIAKMSSGGNVGISGSSSDTQNQVGNITFVCEYLMGMPTISAIVAYADATQVQQAVKVGPCFSENTYKDSIKIHKDVYLFVTPTFIKQFAGDLDSVIDNQNYDELVTYLQSLIQNTGFINKITDDDGNTIPNDTLQNTTEYMITGSGFGQQQGILTLGSYSKTGKNQLNITSWSENVIKFKGMAGKNPVPKNASKISLYSADGSKEIASSDANYTMQ